MALHVSFFLNFGNDIKLGTLRPGFTNGPNFVKFRSKSTKKFKKIKNKIGVFFLTMVGD
jgi:hypothetical protein